MPAKTTCKKPASGTLAAMIGKHVIHMYPHRKYVRPDWITTYDTRDVILMSIAGNYAMIRRPSCFPYVAPLKELTCASSA